MNADEIKEQRKKRLAGIPILYRGMFERVWFGNAGRALRVKCKCLDCTCYQRLEVENCTTVACPLWEIRPYQKDVPEPEDETP